MRTQWIKLLGKLWHTDTMNLEKWEVLREKASKNA